jgi:predicted unusual protein kinase regulating ubiquinone biosynthesis (AarF/ABC1/UbiB family)
MVRTLRLLGCWLRFVVRRVKLSNHSKHVKPSADLHPGNVLVTPDRKLVLLDVGIVLEHGREDHRMLSDVLAAFIRCEGRIAGRRMIDDSNSRLRVTGDHALEEELFIDKIEELTIEAKGKAYLMEKLGTYITIICNAAAQHHVMLNQTFISAALAVKVQEGIALALDPEVEIWRVAIPLILEGERRHGFVKERAQEMLGFDRLVKWLTGQGDTKQGATAN